MILWTALALAAEQDPFADLIPSPPPGYVVVPPGWELVGETITRSVWFVHRGTVTRDAQFTKIWVRIDHARDRTESARTTRGLVVFKCSARTYHWENVIKFDASDAPTDIELRRTRTEDIPPDTLIESVWRVACNRPA